MKFEIFQSAKNQEYYFNLKAKNGQVILSSEGYKQKASAKNGIESVRKNATDDNCYDIRQAKDGRSYFCLCSTNKQEIGRSQMYKSRSGLKNGIESVKTNAPEAEVVDLTAK
ncbi:MAG: YegP family protein [Saprospiraceae bacterium]|nr:YegP family protein [Saprospiraceae bacterium]MCB0626781.1 YegP family protein [Saprospiraceae bacterium]MCB0676437.1 YegP family protein [Saprospiraceae bacterium]MCB0680856.1 YegP family protein [Saprospiraceae bacterium]